MGMGEKASAAVPVIPGRYDVQRDKSGAPCAACGTSAGAALRTVEGIPLMLCLNAYLCRLRWAR